jgi:hypothetical protein
MPLRYFAGRKHVKSIPDFSPVLCSRFQILSSKIVYHLQTGIATPNHYEGEPAQGLSKESGKSTIERIPRWRGKAEHARPNLPFGTGGG